MKPLIIISFVVFSLNNSVYCQHQPSDTVRAVVYKGDTIPYAMLHVADVIGVLSPEAAANMKRYYLLRRDVLRAYPYAKLASQKFIEFEKELNSIDKKRDRKKFVKEKEKEMKGLFEDDLKKLTVNQGRILMKLIYRETGSNTYEVVKELRGGFNAFIWQTTARMFGHNMKVEYDSEGEDYMIEQIVRQVENGQLQIPALYQIKKL